MPTAPLYEHENAQAPEPCEKCNANATVIHHGAGNYNDAGSWEPNEYVVALCPAHHAAWETTQAEQEGLTYVVRLPENVVRAVYHELIAAYGLN